MLTKNRLDLGLTSKKMREKAAASPTQRITRPRMSLTKAETGVRFPKALARRKRGKASCSIARKQYSFCWWNIFWHLEAKAISVMQRTY